MIKFNNKPLPSFLKITGYSFPVLGEVGLRETEIPRRIGTIDSGINIGAKTITFSLLLVPDKDKSILHQADELKEWIKGDDWEVSQLIFDEQPDRYLLGRFANNIELKDLFIAGEGELVFKATDPLKYSTQSSSKASTGGLATFTYNGLEKAPAVITVQITTACKNFTLTHSQTGKVISILGDFKAGQTVVIDCDKKLAKLNGITQMKLIDLENDWIYLQKGTNNIQFNTTGAIKNEFQVKYTEAS